MGIEEAFFAASVEGAGARMLKVEEASDLPGVALDDIRYEGRYPFVKLAIPSMGAVEIAVHGFSPMLFDDNSEDYRDSSLPTAILPWKQPIQVRLRSGLAYHFRSRTLSVWAALPIVALMIVAETLHARSVTNSGL